MKGKPAMEWKEQIVTSNDLGVINDWYHDENM